MDIQPQSQQPISDDQELAKVLAGVNQDTPSDATADPAAAALPPMPPTPADDTAVVDPTPAADPVAPTGDLDSIKQAALGELRPLVDKLNVSPEEKFDTYLLLLRSTDDKALIAPAHEAAKAITDETRRAQALLDIIKEIDFLSNPQQA